VQRSEKFCQQASEFDISDFELIAWKSQGRAFILSSSFMMLKTLASIALYIAAFFKGGIFVSAMLLLIGLIISPMIAGIIQLVKPINGGVWVLLGFPAMGLTLCHAYSSLFHLGNMFTVILALLGLALGFIVTGFIAYEAQRNNGDEIDLESLLRDATPQTKHQDDSVPDLFEDNEGKNRTK